MNEDDSDQMASLLMQMGYRLAGEVAEADVILLNTCSVRAKPEHKVSTKLGELRILKEQNPDMIIGVCGCMAQRQGAAIRRRNPHIDLVIGTAQIERIPELICEVVRSRHPLTALDLPRAKDDAPVTPGRSTQAHYGKLKTFVPVTYGCDNFCSYCVVPYVRGKERSRQLSEIAEEVTGLASQGCKEVTLLGQNVNSYKSPDDGSTGFPELLARLNDIDGLQRIRFTTSHPKDLSDKLIEAMVTLPKVCRHIHLPMQAGDTDVLARMRRGYSVEHYLDLIASLRQAAPEIAISTDILVGFPGETEEQFRNTLQVIEDVRFDMAFMFAYNAIPKTAAAALPDQLTYQEKNARLAKVIELQNRITIEKNTEHIGQVFEVLVEGISPKDPTRICGLTSQNKTVNFEGVLQTIGKLIRVRVTESHLYGFVGETM